MTSQQPIHILLIEDSEGDAFLISEALAENAREKFVVSHAPTVEAAEKKYTAASFNVLLMDLNLPGISGMDAIEKLRRGQPGIPIIVMTGMDDEEKALSIMKHGVQDYLVKGQYGNQVLPRAIRYAIERQHFENKVIELANFDRTTGLINRDVFSERLIGAIALAEQNKLPLVVLMASLRGWKDINATFGHEAGNKLLKAAATRLRECIMCHDEVARLESNEFIILATGDSAVPENLPGFLQGILNRIKEPFEVDGAPVHIGCSIGVATYPACGNDAKELTQHASIAMRRTKERNHDTFSFYTQKLNEEFTERIILEKELRAALTQQTLVPYYQPIVNLRTGQLCGMEALLRWPHPQKGMIPPATFIPIAEKSGIIFEISEYVINAACRDYTLLERVTRQPLYMAVNISTRDLHRKNFVETFGRIMDGSSMNPRNMALEITEGSLMEDSAHIIETLERTRELGVSIFVDDFGTGYSSLSYLSILPVDVLKIDQSFVKNITTSNQNRLIATSAINLAHGLGMQVVVEGIETQAQKELLTQLGCDKAQGFYYARPMPLDALVTWINEHRSYQP